MRIYDDPVIFPRPLLTTAFPPPLQCTCTWAYSPRIYGTIDKPYVLKIYYGMCPVRGHRTRASVGLAIDWELERKRQEENVKRKESAKGQGNQRATRAENRPKAKRSHHAISAQAKKRQRIRQAKEIEAREEYL